mmetsp:Transcript_6278/g.13800  ORF Transcript_6278/g.13800 Transcript_6278/m.13800 type:complete len:354 (-) Transcript_6278:2514-3575(-)
MPVLHCLHDDVYGMQPAPAAAAGARHMQAPHVHPFHMHAASSCSVHTEDGGSSYYQWLLHVINGTTFRSPTPATSRYMATTHPACPTAGRPTGRATKLQQPSALSMWNRIQPNSACTTAARPSPCCFIGYMQTPRLTPHWLGSKRPGARVRFRQTFLSCPHFPTTLLYVLTLHLRSAALRCCSFNRRCLALQLQHGACKCLPARLLRLQPSHLLLTGALQGRNHGTHPGYRVTHLCLQLRLHLVLHLTHEVGRNLGDLGLHLSTPEWQVEHRDVRGQPAHRHHQQVLQRVGDHLGRQQATQRAANCCARRADNDLPHLLLQQGGSSTRVELRDSSQGARGGKRRAGTAAAAAG